MCTKHSNLFMARENKDHCRSPVIFLAQSGGLESPASLHLLQTVLHPCALNVLLLHSKTLAGAGRAHLSLTQHLGSWKSAHLHRWAWWQWALDLGSSPIKMMGTQCFQIASLESSAQSWHRACLVLQKMVRSSCGHTTSSNSLGHIQAQICKEEKLQFSSTSIIFPSPRALGKGAGGVQEGNVPIREVKAFPASPAPASRDGFVHMKTWDTMGMRGSASHSHSCGPAGLR